ncbi:MAG TPA: hypothetical protein ENI52_05430 [Thermoplasmata archaeon]|nr:hypothetical protein [Thermoplasmata archaeon]
MYEEHRTTRKQMMELCKKIENENLKILEIINGDNIIFKKRNVHYANIDLKLEKVLTTHFGKRIYVTTRSMKTIERLK